MGAINLPDLVQKVRVDTKSMTLATQRAAAMGAKFKAMSKDVVTANKAVDVSFERNQRALREYASKQTVVIERNKELSKATKKFGVDLQASSRNIKSFERSVAGLVRTGSKVSTSLDRVERSTNKMTASLDNASAKTGSLGREMTSASRKARNFEKSTKELGDSVRRIPKNKKVAVSLNTKERGSKKAEADIDFAARDRRTTIDVDVDRQSVSHAMALFDQLTGGPVRGRGGVFRSITREIGSFPFRLMDMITESFSKLGSVFGKTADAATEGAEALSKTPGVFARMGTSIGKAVSALAAAGPAIGLVVVPAVVAGSAAMGTLASTISMLGGSLVTMTGTLTQAIVAPLLAAVPAVAGFGAGALTAVGIIKKWAENSKVLKRETESLNKVLEDYAERIGPSLDRITTQVGNGMESLARKFGDSTKKIVEDLEKQLASKDMQKFFSQWSDSLPKSFQSLGLALNDFAMGLTAFFVPILPYSEQLSSNIGDAAQKFRDWATSASGQDAITTWMDRAWKISGKLWRGFRDIGVAVANIFGIGVQESGEDFARTVERIGKKFREWTGDEENQEKIKQFFRDVERFGKRVEVILGDLGVAFDRLDSPAARAMLDHLMEFASLATAHFANVAYMVDKVNVAVTWLISKIGSFTESMDWSGIWEGIKEGFRAGLENVKEFIKSPVTAIGDAIVAWLKHSLGIASPSQKMIDIMNDVAAGLLMGLLAIPAKIAGAVLGIATSIITGITGGLAGLPGQVASKLGEINTTIIGKGAEIGASAVAAFAPLPGKIAGAVVGLAPQLATWATSAWSSAQGAFGSGTAGTVGSMAAVPGRIAGAVVGLGPSLLSWASGAWRNADGSFKTGATGTVSHLGGVPGRIISGMSSAASKLSSWGSTSWRSADSSFKSGSSGTVTHLSGVPSRVVSSMASMGAKLSGWASTSWRSANSGTSSGVSSVVSTVSTLPGRVYATLAAMAGAMVVHGMNIGQGLANGINAKAGAVYAAAANIARMASIAVAAVAAIRSPSRVTTYLGEMVGEGFAKGISSQADRVKKVSVELAKAPAKALKDQMSATSKMVQKYKGKMTLSGTTAKWTGKGKAPAEVTNQIKKLNSAKTKVEDTKKHQAAVLSLAKTADAKQNAVTSSASKAVAYVGDIIQSRYDAEDKLITSLFDKRSEGLGSSIDYAEEWYKARLVEMGSQRAELDRMSLDYFKKKDTAAVALDRLKKAEADKTYGTKAAVASKSSSTSTVSQTTEKKINISITNNNPVREPSSQTVIRNLTNIANLTM